MNIKLSLLFYLPKLKSSLLFTGIFLLYKGWIKLLAIKILNIGFSCVVNSII